MPVAISLLECYISLNSNKLNVNRNLCLIESIGYEGDVSAVFIESAELVD